MKILIISPNFPPNNTPDMHRIRVLLPYLIAQGIEVQILAISPEYSEAPFDNYILKSIPEEIRVHRTKALDSKKTRMFGLGNIGIRAFFFFLKKGNRIIPKFKPDIIFFSTTVFAIIPLGRIWKRKFNIPFIVDMQDPWRNDYYLDLPKNKRPPKFWFAHRLNSVLERYTIPHVSGLISVNRKYIEILKKRYPKIENSKSLVLPLGATKNDFILVEKLNIVCSIKFDNSYINAVYTGVVPENMKFSIEAIIIAVKKYNKTVEKKIRLYFIGTNYAPKDKQKLQVKPIAEKYDYSDFVFELTNRIPYFEAIKMMQTSNLLLLPGTFDEDYTASKLYPYILTKKKILAVFSENSELKDVLNELSNIPYISFTESSDMKKLSESIFNKIDFLLNRFTLKINETLFNKYTDSAMTESFLQFIFKIINK